jgi:hypothetical protein
VLDSCASLCASPFEFANESETFGRFKPCTAHHFSNFVNLAGDYVRKRKYTERAGKKRNINGL